MRIVNKTCSKCACNKVCNHDVYGFENCGNFISAEDVLEVVKCKDCKFWNKLSHSAQGRCILSGNYPTGNWFCANGVKKRTERRNNNGR